MLLLDGLGVLLASRHHGVVSYPLEQLVRSRALSDIKKGKDVCRNEGGASAVCLHVVAKDLSETFAADCDATASLWQKKVELVAHERADARRRHVVDVHVDKRQGSFGKVRKEVQKDLSFCCSGKLCKHVTDGAQLRKQSKTVCAQSSLARTKGTPIERERGCGSARAPPLVAIYGAMRNHDRRTRTQFTHP